MAFAKWVFYFNWFLFAHCLLPIAFCLLIPTFAIKTMKEKTCDRCTKKITCQAENVTLCVCATLILAPETTHFLKKTNYDCLCNACLLELNNMVIKSQTSVSNAVLNEDYYFENNLVVFTEYYHLKRGYCCGNGCRECAYGR